MNLLAKWWRKPAPERWRLLEAAVCLTLARLCLGLLPFRWLMPLLRDHDPDGVSAKSEGSGAVRRALHSVSGKLPWESTCLVRVLAGRYMLVRRDLPAAVFFGVQNPRDQGFSAHAWLKSGKLFVTGEEGHERFQVLKGPQPKRRGEAP